MDRPTNSASIVAIDGPVGVGKSTVARRVASELGIRHVDTGAMYRAVAWRATQLSPEERRDPRRLGDLARDLALELPGDGRALVDGRDISTELRDESISRFVSLVADSREVREALVAMQRRIGLAQPSVMEGRDIGSVVFPDAACKIYLDASPEIRIDRRMAQLEAGGKHESRAAVGEALLARDDRDRNRPWGGLCIAPGARIVDTTYLQEGAVVELIVAMVRAIPGFPRGAATR